MFTGVCKLFMDSLHFPLQFVVLSPSKNTYLQKTVKIPNILVAAPHRGHLMDNRWFEDLSNMSSYEDSPSNHSCSVKFLLI